MHTFNLFICILQETSFALVSLIFCKLKYSWVFFARRWRMLILFTNHVFPEVGILAYFFLQKKQKYNFNVKYNFNWNLLQITISIISGLGIRFCTLENSRGVNCQFGICSCIIALASFFQKICSIFVSKNRKCPSYRNSLRNLIIHLFQNVLFIKLRETRTRVAILSNVLSHCTNGCYSSPLNFLRF